MSYLPTLYTIMKPQVNPDAVNALQNSLVRSNTASALRSVFFFMTIAPIEKTDTRLIYKVNPMHIDASMNWCQKRMNENFLRVNKLSADTFEVVGI